MVDSEQEMLHEKQDQQMGERRPFESSRQATYEDSVTTEEGWEQDED